MKEKQETYYEYILFIMFYHATNNERGHRHIHTHMVCSFVHWIV